jgi:hypothetical protein
VKSAEGQNIVHKEQPALHDSSNEFDDNRGNSNGIDTDCKGEL